MKTFCAVVLLLVFTGCSAVTSVPVRVAVPVPCNPPEVREPTLPIDELRPDANLFEKVRAMWATIEALEAYGQQLQAALDVCRDK